MKYPLTENSKKYVKKLKKYFERRHSLYLTSAQVIERAILKFNFNTIPRRLVIKIEAHEWVKITNPVAVKRYKDIVPFKTGQIEEIILRRAVENIYPRRNGADRIYALRQAILYKELYEKSNKQAGDNVQDNTKTNLGSGDIK